MNYFAQLIRKHPIIVQMLRFVAIGALNTALDFIVLNFITKTFGIEAGVGLGVLNVISFSAAVVQSYLWNKAWAFAESSNVSVFQNAVRLIMVGGLGIVGFLAVFIGAAQGAANLFYLLVLAGFIVIEGILWMAFGLRLGKTTGTGMQFASFLVVSVVGLLINSVIIVVATHFITPYLEFTVNADTIKNVAKVLATGLSLLWNFVGYKLIVFKR